MKKILLILLVVLGISGCGNSNTQSGGNNIDTLSIAFVPSKNPDEILQKTGPLADMIKNKLSEKGYNVNKVDISVSSSYEAAGEGLAAGTIDVGFIPAGTYILNENDGVEPILAATRFGLNKTSDNPNDWNDGQPTTTTDEQVTFYDSLIVAGPSQKGKELAQKSKENKLTWEDLKSAKWCTSSPTSSAGYIYPNQWLKDNYQKTIEDLGDSTIQTQSYGDSLSRLATESCDISLGYGDYRIDYEKDWIGNNIWTDTNLIGIAGPISNDIIAISNNSKNMSDGLKKALQDSMIEIAQTPEGLEAISVYSHKGYKVAKPEDFEMERKINQNK